MSRCIALGVTLLGVLGGWLWWRTHPYLGEFEQLILSRYGLVLLRESLLFVFDIACLAYFFKLGVTMNRTGRKLEHIDTGLYAGNSVSRELSERLARE